MKVYELTKHQTYIVSLFESSYIAATKVIGWQTLGGDKISRIIFQLKINDINNSEVSFFK